MMEKSNTQSKNRPSEIQCIEVLVANTADHSSGSLRWTLSIYSLQNQPVSGDLSFHNCDIYQFMIFDWKRTIQKLLEKHQVSFCIIQYFSPGDAHTVTSAMDTALHERNILAALDQLQGKVPHQEETFSHSAKPDRW